MRTPGRWAGETPLDWALWVALFPDPSVRCGKEGRSLSSPQQRWEDQGDVVCETPRFTCPQLVFSLTLSPTRQTQDHTHTPSFLLLAVALKFQLVTSEDRFFRKCNCSKGRGSAFTSAEVPLAPQAGVSSPYPAARFRPLQPRWSGGVRSLRSSDEWFPWIFRAALSAKFSVRCQRVLKEWIMALKAPCWLGTRVLDSECASLGALLLAEPKAGFVPGLSDSPSLHFRRPGGWWSSLWNCPWGLLICSRYVVRDTF